MRKKICLMLILAIAGMANVNAQMRISGSEVPNQSAVLDLNPDDNTLAGNATLGLALPRVSLRNSGDAFPLSAHVKGMSVYNMATAGDVSPGMYFNDGTKWLRQLDSEDWETWQSSSKVFEQTVTKPADMFEVEIVPEISQFFPKGLYWCEVRLSFPTEVLVSSMFYQLTWQHYSIRTRSITPATGATLLTSHAFSFPSFLPSSMDTYPMLYLSGVACLVDVDVTLTIYRIL